VFPSLLPNQIATLAQNYMMRAASRARRRLETQTVRDGAARRDALRPRVLDRRGRRAAAEDAMFDENNRVVEMSTFLEVQINAKLDKSMVQPSFRTSRRTGWCSARRPNRCRSRPAGG
jgi:hypothetical protein